MNLTVEDMVDFARGAAFLGAGGGGDPYCGRLFAQQMMREYGVPKVVDADDVPDAAACFIVAMLGAPTVTIEKLMDGKDADLVIDTMEQVTGRKVEYILPAEVGGINSTLPIAIAARRGLPVIDADGMGRAFPEIHMVTYHVYGVPISPVVIANDHMESVVVRSASSKSAEDISRAVAMRMGLSVMISAYPMTGADVKRTAVRNTLSLAHGIGRAIAQGRHGDGPVDSLLDYLRTSAYYNKCAVIFDGKIVDLLRETTHGFSIGRVVLEALDGGGRRMDVRFQNEHLIARDETGLRAIVPDLICMVDRETAEPITTEGLKYGQRLKIIGVSAPPSLRTSEALACFGPQAFGLAETFEPIEKLLAL
ncbi:MAG: DUF917 domain-containing protein [Gammaproteobacteria bacterium]|nr:DUF917 domain-containing protein [Gammaproteobacteria bacterium]